MTFAVLRFLRKIALITTKLKISTSWEEISFFESFKFHVGILLGPVGLFEFKEEIMFHISCLFADEVKRSIWIICFEEFREMFAWKFNLWFSPCCNGTEEVIETVCYFYRICCWFIILSQWSWSKESWFVHRNYVSDFLPWIFLDQLCCSWKNCHNTFSLFLITVESIFIYFFYSTCFWFFSVYLIFQ